MSRRRYKVGLNPDYDHRFDVVKGKSSILGGDTVNKFNMARPGILNSIRTIKHYLGQTEALSKKKEEELAAIIENWQNGLLRSGRPIPAEPPQQLTNQQLRAEAELDILLEESDWLKKELAKREAAAKKIVDDNVLYFGPIGSGKGDPQCEIDGQVVIEKDGELVISCAKSPYDGMKLPDYFSMIVHPFLKARREAVQAFHALPIEQRGAHALNPGGCRPVARENLPPRPAGV